MSFDIGDVSPDAPLTYSTKIILKGIIQVGLFLFRKCISVTFKEIPYLFTSLIPNMHLQDYGWDFEICCYLCMSDTSGDTSPEISDKGSSCMITQPLLS